MALVAALLATAAVVTIPPPAESADQRLSLAAIAGVGSPDWAHVGVLGRLGVVGGSLTLGTVAMAHDLTAAGRWFLPEPVNGAFFEAGASVLRLQPASDQTPGDLFWLGFVGVGWQLTLDRLVLDAAIGPPPSALGGPLYPPIQALNAMDLPRFRLAAGYAF